ncbi:MAG: NlpC/P60 family protein [Steroidobacteraceae bacterium]
MNHPTSVRPANPHRAGRGGAATVCAVLLLAACASVPQRAPLPVPATTRMRGGGAHLVEVSQTLLGIPYRYGGAASTGFDCSGLVFFVHAAVGLTVPRTVAAQRAAVQPVPIDHLEPGDLVFFRIGAVPDHVGIYAGNGRFIHAPSAGRVVSYTYLDDPWYATRLVGAGRFWSGPPLAGVGATGP